MNKYDKLARNTLIFAIGSFSSKAMVFLLMPLYTRLLSPADFGTSELIVSTSNLIMPFMMLSINEAVIRYGMDRAYRRREVFSIGISTVLVGFLVFCLFAPVFYLFDGIKGYTLLVYLYVLMGALRAVCAQFVRSIGQIKIYTFDGIFATFTTIALNVLFLVVFKMGVEGFVLSVVVSNIISVLLLFWLADLPRYLRLGGRNKALRSEMLRYSIPLIPSTMFWWITNVSDRYLVTYYAGAGANGIYSMGYKIPTLMTIVSGIFYQSWQISAIEEYSSPEKALDFYSEVLNHYSSLLFCAASGLILLCIPITYLLVSSAFMESWRYVPFLVIAEVFSTLVTFLGTFYMVVKRSNSVLLAIGVGGISNILMNIYLIPIYGGMGAAMATMISYLLAFAVRLVDVRRFVPIRINLLKVLLCFGVLLLQTFLLFQETPLWWLIQAGFVALMALINIKSVLSILRMFLSKLSIWRAPQ